MQLPDANVLICAFRPEAEQHRLYRGWLEKLITGNVRYAVSELVLSSVVRILTTAHIFSTPQRIVDAFEFADFIRNQPQCQIVSPGPTHWQIFSELCLRNKIAGARVSDAYLAALALEHGCEIITNDRDFARFPGLRWRHPFE